ncbi:nuclease-related domain-containing protein [Arsukibacterium indicum]|uniref:NERD domain-containing protein n=1 Tax=Arsukibacterium indicum TaxID=2848612 RepID=A0ABS6MJZ4_9GAMM|nr:nuclease-related domain-containing protein [Arsukibacterium indicum]MBV2129138.1 NERD domain-containing protein [Arsukibacterium indicum]
MRCWRLTLSLLLLSAPLAYGQPQYSEAACILLQQQIERFSHQPQLSTYQDSKRQFDNHCQNPLPAPTHDLVLTNIPAKPVTLTNSAQNTSAKPVAVLPAKAVAAAKPAVANPADGMNQILGATVKMLAIPFGILLAIVLARVILAKLFGITDSSIKGALAERQLRRVLQRELPAGYQHYANLVLPTTTGDYTEIDHLVLSPFGIFVIEVKNYKGWIFGGEKQPQWTVQNFRSKHSFQNPLRQNYKHTEAVKYLLELNSSANEGQVYSVIAFSSRAEFKTRMPTNAIYIELIGDYLQQFTQSCFSDEQLRQFAARLNMAADRRKVLGKLHMQQFDA